MVPAASGGVGLLLCQWCAALGADVIGNLLGDLRVMSTSALVTWCRTCFVKSKGAAGPC